MNENWFGVLKTPFMDYRETSLEATGDWGHEKTGGTQENPIVYIENDRPLQGETWDEQYLTQYRRQTTFFEAKWAEVSSYGRVKIDDIMQKPEKSARSNKMVTKIQGTKSQYDKHRPFSSYGRRGESDYQPKYQGDKKLRTTGVPYLVSVKLMKNIGEDIPPNAELFVNGESIGQYSDWASNED